MKRTQTWTTPGGQVYSLFARALETPHLLIAGTTGSGKSVLINGLIATILHRFPSDAPGGAQMILVDPKRVELAQYAAVPHTLTHAKGFSPDAWRNALQYAVSVMDQRYNTMEQRREKIYTGGDLYIIIDEWAAVYKNGGRDCFNAVLRLVSEGRAARCHAIIATQVPKADILPTQVRDCIDHRFCLKTSNKLQSRVIMDASGCENLPEPRIAKEAQAFYCDGNIRTLYRLPYVQQAELDALCQWWQDQRQPRRGLFRR